VFQQESGESHIAPFEHEESKQRFHISRSRFTCCPGRFLFREDHLSPSFKTSKAVSMRRNVVSGTTASDEALDAQNMLFWALK